MKRCSWHLSGFVFLLVISLIGCSRSSAPRRLSDFKVEFGDNNIPAQMTARRAVTADVTIKNISKNKWPSQPNDKGRNAVHLSYHWFDRKGAVVAFDGLRTALPNDVQPGSSVQLKAMIQPPDHAGEYTLEVTLVQEGIAWFPERNGDKITRAVNVIDSDAEQTSLPVARSRAGIKSAVGKQKNDPGRRNER